MSKRNQKQQKNNNNLHKYFPKTTPPEDKSPPPTADKNDNKKRAISNSSNEVRHSKEKSLSMINPSKKHQLLFVLKSTPIDQIIQNCPKISVVTEQIENRSGLERQLILSLLKKYLQTSSHSLWSTKYAPNNCDQLFNHKAGEKIRNWLTAFFEYKNKIKEEQDSFINDFDDQKSCSIYRNIRKEKWNLDALVVRGDAGTGKSAAVRAVALEMGLDMQKCGNDYNQTKYLKEKHESTQSQSVKTAYSFKIKTEKNAQMITKFMNPVQKEKPSDTKKGQLLHNVGLVFPDTDAHKFYTQLARCIQLSKIPFIMTSSSQNLPHQCLNYDIIDFETGNTDKVEQILWTILHLEQLLPLNKYIEIIPERVFQELNNQTNKVEFRDIYPLAKIRQVCRLMNYRLDMIFTFLQQYYRETSLDLGHLWMNKLKSYNGTQFLNQILTINDQQSINSIDEKEKIISQDPISTQDSEENTVTNEPQFYEQLRKLKILTIEDTLVMKEQYPTLNRSSLKLSEWEQHPHTCIDINVHRSVHQILAKNANEQINEMMERGKSSLRLNQLHVLPMLAREKRASRNFRPSEDSFFKLFNANQSYYLRQFGHLLRPE